MSKTKYVQLNPDGETIYSIADIGLSAEELEVTVDDDFDDMEIDRYKYVDGALVYDEALASQAEAAKADVQKSRLQNMQVMNLLSLVVQPQLSTMEFTATTAAKVSSFAEPWSGDGVRYDPGQIRTYQGNLYIVNEGQGHTSQPGWDPVSAPSLWSLIKIAPDGNREWVDPTGAHNDYAEGEYCWYPDYETGALYQSKQNGNVWPPNDTSTSTWVKVTSI